MYYYNEERDHWILENGVFATDPKLIEIEQMSYNALRKIKFYFYLKIIKCKNNCRQKKEKWRNKGIIYDTVNGKYIKKYNINLDNLSPVRQ